MDKELETGQYSEREAQQRRDTALRRALNTPHQPHKPNPKGGGSKAVATPRRKAVRA